MMYSNSNHYINQQIQKGLDNFRESLIENIPVRVKSFDKDKLLLELESLIDKRIFSNVPFIINPNIQMNLENLEFGIFLSINYYFYSIQSEGKIETPIKTTQSNYGLFLPILGKNSNFSKNKDNEITIFDKENKKKFQITKEGIIIQDENNKQKIAIENGIILEDENTKQKVELGNQISIIGGNQPLSIKNDIGSLKDLITALIECINLASLSTGNQGAPVVPNPQLSPKIAELQTKLNQILG